MSKYRTGFWKSGRVNPQTGRWEHSFLVKPPGSGRNGAGTGGVMEPLPSQRRERSSKFQLVKGTGSPEDTELCGREGCDSDLQPQMGEPNRGNHNKDVPIHTPSRCQRCCVTQVIGQNRCLGTEPGGGGVPLPVTDGSLGSNRFRSQSK